MDSPGLLPPLAPSAHLSFAERTAQMSRASATNLIEGDNIMRDINRGLPGDRTQRSRRSRSKPELGRQRSHYFEDAFSAREANNPAKDRVRNEAMVVADLKTNFIVRALLPSRRW